ncbi:MAG: eukaryotic-like serine/threonine-protein kinase [Verrucomicrobiota bacterium]|jgi:serine/threonine protein kinase/Flp pilus assembly protein TadD
MQSERWRSCTDIFHAALERPPGERDAFLTKTCANDEPLRRQVELLLKYHDQTGDFIGKPAFEVAPELLLDDAAGLVGQQLGHYRIESVLGVGGMGIVYLAQDERLMRRVALKLLPGSLVASEANLERLKREARTASALNHPNIVTIHEIGEVNGTHYIATEFIEGPTLRERIAQGPIPPNEALDIAKQIAGALSVAHAAGIVHRDIKPENIMLRPDGYLKVLDFGIAKFAQQEASAPPQATTQPGMILGTTRYMSPEQARGFTVDHRTDIWSLGVVIYEMLTGKQPFEGATSTDLLIAIAERDPVPLAASAPPIPLPLVKLTTKALEKEREKRHQTANDLLHDLKSAARQLDTNSATSSGRRRVVLVSAAIAAILIAALFSLRFLPVHSAASRSTDAKSLAVLPLKNLSGDAAQEYFSDGLSEELINRLGQIHGLRVIGRNSSFHFKNKADDSRAVGKVLGVAHLLEGSVRTASNRLRISVQLVRTADGSQLWSETYDREMKDIFAVQAEIARAVADQLRVTLLAIDLPVGVEPSNKNLDAYNAYLKGEFYLAHFNVENETKAVDSFDEAIRFDPGFAEAYAAKAFALARMGYFSGVKGADLFEQARTAAKTALSLEPKLSRAHVVLAYLYMSFDWNLPAAESEFKNLDESVPLFAHALAVLRSYQGRLDESIRLDQKALALDPLYSVYHTNLGVWLFQSGRFDEAETHWRKALELQPDSDSNHALLATVAAVRGQVDSALREAQQEPKGVVRDAAIATALAAGHDRAAADTALKSLVDNHADSPYRIALVYAFRNEREPMFKWLEQAYALHDQRLPSMSAEILLKPYRSDPRFIALCEKLRLPLPK